RRRRWWRSPAATSAPSFAIAGWQSRICCGSAPSARARSSRGARSHARIAMPIIDERGRVFGRLNLVDAAIVALVLGPLPAACGAYRLFKDPRPTLSKVVPGKLNQGPNLQTEIFGENLRPYMRVSFGDFQGRTFLFGSPTSAIVQLPDLEPGQYDVVLYDYQ